MGLTYNNNNVTGLRNPGATEYPITIGDGVNSWGRFNTSKQDYYVQSILKSVVYEPGGASFDYFDSAIDANGDLHIVVDFSGTIQYLSSNQSPTPFTPVTIGTRSGGIALGIDIGTETTPYVHVAWIDVVSGGGGNETLQYRYKTAASGGAFSTETYNFGNIGSAIRFGSINISPNNIPYLSYYRSDGANSGVYIMDRGTSLPNASAWGSIVKVTTDSLNVNSYDSNSFVFFKQDSTIFVMARTSAAGIKVYQSSGGPDNVKYSFGTGGGGNADDSYFIPRGVYVESTGLTTANIHVAYWNDASDKVLYRELAIDAANTISLVGSELTVKTLTAAASQEAYPSIALDSNGFIYVFHREQNSVLPVDPLWLSFNRLGSFESKLMDYNDGGGPDNGGDISAIFLDGDTIKVVALSDPHPAVKVKYFIWDKSVLPDITGALNDAISSLPTTGGKIKILPGNYILDTTLEINQSFVQIEGSGNSSKISIDANSAFIHVGSVSASNVSISNLKLISTNTVVTTTPMLLLEPTNSSYCFVTDIVFEGSGTSDKDIEWTIANGHIVDSNISTTNTSGLGGI